MKPRRGEQPFLSDVAWMRHNLYFLLSGLLLPPAPEILAAAAVVARELRPAPWAPRMAFWQAADTVLKRVEGSNAPMAAQLRESYRQLFVGNGASPTVSLCESGYLTSTASPGLQCDPPLEGEYAGAGLSVSTQVGAADHAAVELEFLAYLCSREAEAWERHALGEALSSLRRQQRFLDQHPGRWIPTLAGVLGSRPTCFYTDVIRAVRGLVAHDADFADALVTALEATGR